MNLIRLKRIDVLLTTDLLARGIDLNSVNFVISFDFPRKLETYFHRIGRTARYDKKGISIVFISSKKEKIKLIENIKYKSNF